MSSPKTSNGGRRSEQRLRCTCDVHSGHPDIDCPKHGECAHYGHLTDEDGDCHCGAVSS